MLVQQEVKAHLSQRLDSLLTILCFLSLVTILIDGIVMIAQYGKNAILSLQLAKTGYLRG